MFPSAVPAGFLNVHGDMAFTKLGSRIMIATGGSRAEQRTLFTAVKGQSAVFGAMPGIGGPNAAIQVYAQNLDPMPAGGFQYGDLRAGNGYITLTSASLGPDSSATGAPAVLPFRFNIDGKAHVIGIDGSWSFNGGQTTIDASGNLVLTGTAQATQIGLGITPVEAVHIGVGGKLRIDNSVGYHFTNYYNAGLDRLDWEWASAGAIMALDSTGALLVASTIVAGGSITAASLVIGGVTWSGAGNNAAVQRIGQVVTAGSQATVVFSSIPAGFTNLLVVCNGRDTTSGTSDSNIFLYFNADQTAANYTNPEALAVTTSTATGAQPSTSTNGGVICTFPNNGVTTGRSGSWHITIPSYAATSFFKAPVAYGYDTTGTSSSGSVYIRGFEWASTAAITKLTFTAGTAFKDGSTFTLYGMP